MDLEKTVYFYDKEKSKDPVFTLRNLSVSVLHDLHCWELGFYFTINRYVENVGPSSEDRLIYYDRAFFISLTLKTFTGKEAEKTQVYPLDSMRYREF